MMTLLSLLPALFGLAAPGPPPPPPPAPEFPNVRVTYIENKFVVRVPVRPPPPAASNWREKKGPKCIRLEDIRGALLSGSDHLDLVLDRGKRLRAKLNGNCPGLDFYEGFYLNSPDQRICARRDVVRGRMGGSCEISDFRRLVP